MISTRAIRKLLASSAILLLAATHQAAGHGPRQPVFPEDAQELAQLDEFFTFMITSDLGRNGYYDQVPVAEMMGSVADLAGPDFIAALGDVHHFWGVRSVDDPLWNTNFEWIYTHPELMIPWHPVLGNHEYRGWTQPVLDYSAVSRRWEMPARYYAITEELAEGVEVLVMLIDTPLLIDKYRDDPRKFRDAGAQSMEEELAWIDATLGGSDAKWKVVMGHHPIYAGTTKEARERNDLQARLQPLLDRHDVDVYVRATSTTSSTSGSPAPASTTWSTARRRGRAWWSPSRERSLRARRPASRSARRPRPSSRSPSSTPRARSSTSTRAPSSGTLIVGRPSRLPGEKQGR